MGSDVYGLPPRDSTRIAEILLSDAAKIRTISETCRSAMPLFDQEKKFSANFLFIGLSFGPTRL